MTVDLHTHLVSSRAGEGARFNYCNKVVQWRLGVRSVDAFRAKFVADLAEGPADKAVVCAIENSPLVAGNAETLAFCRAHPGFLYGVNLNPLSPTLADDVAQAVRDGAVLVKLHPSFQRIDPADDACQPFWHLMARHHLPVLVHTGHEHALRGGSNRLNDPARLARAAALGVTLVCAHCGCHMMLQERNGIRAWMDLVRTYPNVWGDASAFCGCVRHYWLKRTLADPLLRSRLVFGTDYPAFPYVFKRTSRNVFREWSNFFTAYGCDDAFFSRGAGLVNLEERT